jgi:hypothetical protein
MKLIVIPSDSFISIDGIALVFPFSAGAGIHAIQWDGASGTIETTSGNQSTSTNLADVQPFIDAYNTEAARLAVIAATPLPLAAVKALKVKQLKAARDAAILADVTIGTRTWPSDDAFKLKLAAITARLVRGKPAPAKLRGTTGPAINTPTLAQLDTIDDAIAAQEDAAWDRYWLRKDAVQAAFDAGDAVAINTVTW